MEHGNMVNWSQYNWEERGEHTLYCQFCCRKAGDDDSDDCWCALLWLVALVSCVTPAFTTNTLMILDMIPLQSAQVHIRTVTGLPSAIQPPRSPEVGDNIKEFDPSAISTIQSVLTTNVVQGRWDRPVNQDKRLYVVYIYR